MEPCSACFLKLFVMLYSISKLCCILQQTTPVLKPLFCSVAVGEEEADPVRELRQHPAGVPVPQPVPWHAHPGHWHPARRQAQPAKVGSQDFF